MEQKKIAIKKPKQTAAKKVKTQDITKEVKIDGRGFDINERYSKKSDLEHVLLRPDMYVGGTDKIEKEEWVWDSEHSKVVSRRISYSPALYKIFDEVLVNARDHSERDETCNRIRVDFDKTTGTIIVENNGSGIPVEWHEDGNCHLTELIFGVFKSGENFSDNEKKIVGGRNGTGSKCCDAETILPTWDGQLKKARDLTLDDKLIGDDGSIRNIKSILYGSGKMYEIVQRQKGDSYRVNDQHILTLQMTDHKVIFWNAAKNGWSVLWWDHNKGCVRAKNESLGTANNYVECPECKISLYGNLTRHYKRVHKKLPIPKLKRRSATKKGPAESDESKAALERLKVFCQTITNDNTLDISIQDYLKLNKTTQYRLSGVRGECVQWPKREVVFDPYLLGLWLGDGETYGTVYTCDDQEVVDYLKDWVTKTYPDGSIYVHQGKRSATTRHECHYKLSRKKGKTNKFKDLMKKVGIWGDKHIPHEYIVNDRETRLQVLAGLIDSDGNVSREGTRIQIAQGMMHEQLSKDIMFLARSLGFFCTSKIRKTSWTHNGKKKFGECYKMSITGDVADIPTIIPRKKLSNEKTHAANTTGQITVRQIEDSEFVGIEIDGNQRFVINDFTVTHNCTNAFSTLFQVDTVDKFTSKRYTQRWENNMSVRHAPVIEKCTKAPYTKVTFTPDYQRLGASSLADPGLISLLERRVYDMAACTREEVIIYLNGEKLVVRTFPKYVDLFLGTNKTDRPRVQETLINELPNGIVKQWEVAVSLSEDGGFKHFSFVNGIATTGGGTHVDYIRDQIVRKVGKLIRDKNPKNDVKPGYIRENLWIFVNATVINPSFASQTKEQLTTKSDNFGFKHSISDDFVKSIEKRLQLSKRAMGVAELRKDSVLKTTDGAKKKKIYGILKLEDANDAGGRKSSDCVLIVTEGDSAKTLAMAGLQILGRDKYGVMPLKGKLTNARNASNDQLFKNDEYKHLKEIIGLKEGFDYEVNGIGSLRYGGGIWLMTDQDLDGFHIKGLFLNMIDVKWPSLFKIPGFVKCFITPLVRVQSTNPKSRVPAKLFFNMSEFDHFRESSPTSLKGMRVRYLKGLGSSESSEAREYFADSQRFVKEYRLRNETVKEASEQFKHAFGDEFADWRKNWLSDYDENNAYDYKQPVFALEEFIDKELKHFSIYDNKRSLGHSVDGLKISQRKTLWVMRKIGLWNDTKKVLSLAGEISSASSYHHGEKSLMGTVVGMAQTFVGANNVNLLYPSGQFGSRLGLGSDASSERYIFTRLSQITRRIFRPEDDAVLSYEKDDEGTSIEPRYFAPIISMVLVNGCQGIGTGYSTTVPMYNPIDIINRHIELIKAGGDANCLSNRTLIPWYRNFAGSITPTQDEEGIFDCVGVYTKVDDRTIRITELPVGISFDAYKAFIEKRLVEAAPTPTVNAKTGERGSIDHSKFFIKDYQSLTFPSRCDYTITFADSKVLDEMLEDPYSAKGLLKKMRLITRISVRNMYLFGTNGAIRKFATPEEIIKYHYDTRLPLYAVRKQYQLDELTAKIAALDKRQRFIQLVLDGVIEYRNRPKADIAAQLREHDLVDDQSEDATEGSDPSDAVLTPSMKALLKISAWDLTREEVEKFLSKIAELKDTRAKLEATSCEQIWLAELQELWIEMNAFLRESSLDLEDQELAKMLKPKAAPKAPKAARATKVKVKN